jgi:hypothetical protein
MSRPKLLVPNVEVKTTITQKQRDALQVIATENNEPLARAIVRAIEAYLSK